jgi:hypothetical protein
MEIAFREIDGEVKSVQLLPTTDPPSVAEAADSEEYRGSLTPTFSTAELYIRG